MLSSNSLRSGPEKRASLSESISRSRYGELSEEELEELEKEEPDEQETEEADESPGELSESEDAVGERDELGSTRDEDESLLALDEEEEGSPIELNEPDDPDGEGEELDNALDEDESLAALGEDDPEGGEVEDETLPPEGPGLLLVSSGDPPLVSDDSVSALFELSITIPPGCLLSYIGYKLKPEMKMECRCDGRPTQRIFEASNRMAPITTRTIPPPPFTLSTIS